MNLSDDNQYAKVVRELAEIERRRREDSRQQLAERLALAERHADDVADALGRIVLPQLGEAKAALDTIGYDLMIETFHDEAKRLAKVNFYFKKMSVRIGNVVSIQIGQKTIDILEHPMLDEKTASPSASNSAIDLGQSIGVSGIADLTLERFQNLLTDRIRRISLTKSQAA